MVVTGVPITSTAGAELSRMDAPLMPPAATMRSVSGTIGPVAARDSAAIRAVQNIGTTALFEAATARGDAADGTYSVELPAAQPRLASYSTRLPLVFSAAGTAGRYTMSASASGFETQLELIDVSSGSATWNPSLLVP
jgi:hypothetical protein